MSNDILQNVLSRITALNNSEIYDITLTPKNNTEIQLIMSNENYLISRGKVAGFRTINKILNINEQIHLEL